MKKFFLLFLFLIIKTTTASIEYEIFEYSIRDIRMRKKLHAISSKKEFIISIDENEYTSPCSDEKKTTKHAEQILSTTSSTHDAITQENLKIISTTQKTVSPKKKIVNNTPVKKESEVISVTEKKPPYLQKEFDLLSVEPVVAKKSDPVINAETKKSTQILAIENNINQEMITFKHWSGSYSPEFSIVINEMVIPKNIEIEVPLEEPLKIEYKALFPYGYSSADCVNYEPKRSVKKIALEFDWNKTPRIIITELE